MNSRPWFPLLAGCVLCIAGATSATADCAEELTALERRISKDGSLAPLQTESEAATGEAVTTDSSGAAGAKAGVAKDGSDTPLQTDEAATGAAVSADAAQAQQQAGDNPRSEALEKAQEALAAGDEEGCMAAIEEARQL